MKEHTWYEKQGPLCKGHTHRTEAGAVACALRREQKGTPRQPNGPPETEPLEIVTLKLPKGLKQEAFKAADRAEVSLSELIRTLIQAHVKG